MARALSSTGPGRGSQIALMSHPSPKRASNSERSAFTLLELSVVVAIVLILAGLLFANRERLLASLEQATCSSRMRSIRVALGNYLQDHDSVWPQGPRPQEADWSAFWLRTLEPYDIQAATWQCPTIRRVTRGVTDEGWALHYVPTMFGKAPGMANRWATHPWLIEVADAHGKGPLICFPDGAIKPLSRVLAEQAAQ